ncbi:hypothetical protein CANTEDRAFT_136783 [Yamadazyma tenuis ATCC 10573]|uniref:Nonsense-mediated mRNA decay factor n=1 Tax=Candida tenuis (strain ATCC 10573 / BCRC 21748 / CBS 615 / JCM 9827 / NBRC 10315 / NRRL Y-1498 / VKM Y-70) TaxID=590646 RepID=G3BDH4_CANTC|nr:uncharacterized protein CANTEDRAFT_136783 [Yamadazyma tenuis ATCC 10573]EGV60301.1 hypothetical protein CANTEDRAFT_136783 [Yamadazyma tenuis ATCC 10573]
MSVKTSPVQDVTYDSTALNQIKHFKLQLTNLLNQSFTDPALLLGLNSVILPKFTDWTTKDFDNYYKLLEVDCVSNQVEFNTIKFLDTLWMNFHYPIIKFFKLKHKEMSPIDSQALSKNDPPKLRTVEIRKINDFFIKFTKTTYGFYSDILQYFSTNFQNPLLPSSFLKHFNYELNNRARETHSPTLQANLLYVMHKCLLCLGDLLRHRSFIETNYVLPNISIKNYFQFKSKTGFATGKLLEYYHPSSVMYNLCIQLLPALNEPYNHLGMIHNMSNDKMTAIYWFLRANFTRLSGYKLGLTNLNNLLVQPWVKLDLSNLLRARSPNHGSITNDQLNLMLTSIICYHYLPEKYRLPGNRILGNLKVGKLEFIFLSLNFNENVFQRSQKFTCGVPLEDFYLFQLTLLICFTRLMNTPSFSKFVNMYLEFYLKSLNEPKESTITKNSSALMCIRLLLNWLSSQNKRFLSLSNVKLLGEVMNKMVGDYTVDDLTTKPIRNYYFAEDIMFKDFKLVSHQLKDFNDNHLFEANNIDLLNNNFSSLVVDGVPIFLDNTFIKENQFKSDDAFIQSEVQKYENTSRVLAVLSQFYDLFQDKFTFNGNFVMKKYERKIKIMQQKPHGSIHRNKHPEPQELDQSHGEIIISSIEGHTKPPVNHDSSGSEEENGHAIQNVIDDESQHEESDNDMMPDTSIDEIEEFIRHHTTQLQSQMQQEEILTSTSNPAPPSTRGNSDSWEAEVAATPVTSQTSTQENYSTANSGTQSPATSFPIGAMSMAPGSAMHTFANMAPPNMVPYSGTGLLVPGPNLIPYAYPSAVPAQPGMPPVQAQYWQFHYSQPPPFPGQFPPPKMGMNPNQQPIFQPPFPPNSQFPPPDQSYPPNANFDSGWHGP